MNFSPVADPVLPHRDELLDPVGVRRRLEDAIGDDRTVAIERCVLGRVNYRFGRSLRTVYHIAIDGDPHIVTARMFKRGRSSRARDRASEGAVNAGTLPPIVHDPDIETVFWVFPNDRKIANLDALTRPPGDLESACREPVRQTQLVAYAPEKSATAQWIGPRGTAVAFVKAYADGSGARTRRTLSALRASGGRGGAALTLPRPIAYSDVRRALVLEAVSGTAITRLHEHDLVEGIERLGAAVAALHSLPATDAPGFRRFGSRRLSAVTSMIARARPDVGALAYSLLGALENSREIGLPLVGLHGDVHPKNGLLQDSRVALIDLDQFSIGPSAADIGSVLASLAHDRRIGRRSGADATRLADKFVAGYESLKAIPSDSTLRWHTAAALLVERAGRAVTRLRRSSLVNLNGILEDARALIA